MKVTTLGGAGQVTGSCHLLDICGKKYLIDCGLFQGSKHTESLNWESWGFNPEQIEAVFLTHAHIDHSGRIPKLVKDGFRGKIYTTRPTAALCKILFLDAAHIQEFQAEWKTKKNLRRGLPPVEPLYTEIDALKSLDYFHSIQNDQPQNISPELSIAFRNAGHILGSAILEVWVKEGDTETKIVFSGDIGKPKQLIVEDPEAILEADALFIESTYGNRDHKGFDESKEELREAILYSYNKGEKVLIPAFAVERTQEILYVIGEFFRNKLIPPMPVFLDSPLAIEATRIFGEMREFLDEEAQEILRSGNDPFIFPQLQFSKSVDESQRINTLTGPAIIIAGNGMCTAGRILHHIKHNIWRDGCSLVVVGYQAEGSLGRQIIDGAKKIRVLGEDVAVRARVFTIGGFSSHAGQSDLLSWVAQFRKKTMKVYIIHGEKIASETLAALIREKLGFPTYIPRMGETIAITTTTPEKGPEILYETYLYEIGRKFFELEHLIIRKRDTISGEKRNELATKLKQIELDIENTIHLLN